MLHIKKSNLQKARKFAKTSCFIDGLCAINDNSEFEKKKLQRNLMTRIGISNLKFSFRDVEINVKHREFETELFDKTDAFLFSIVRMPYQDRSIPTRIFFLCSSWV